MYLVKHTATKTSNMRQRCAFSADFWLLQSTPFLEVILDLVMEELYTYKQGMYLVWFNKV